MTTARIIITVEIDEAGKATSQHEIEGIHPFDAGIVLIEVGRDLVREAYLEAIHHHEAHYHLHDDETGEEGK